MSFNKFKSTTIYGNFINDSSGSLIADASFNGNISCNGNINLSKSLYVANVNPILQSDRLNIACDKQDETVYIGNKASLVTINSKKININDGTLDNDSMFQASKITMDFSTNYMELTNMDINIEKVGTIKRTTTFNTQTKFNGNVEFNTDTSFNSNITCNGNINLGSNSKIYNSNGSEFTSGFNSGLNEIQIGGNAGLGQSQYSIAIGGNAGVNQGYTDTVDVLGTSIIANGFAISIGYMAGGNAGTNSVSIGKNCGTNQNFSSISIGRDSGTNQSYNSISIGTLCGKNSREGCLSIGQACGEDNMKQGSLAIGYMCGRFNMGKLSISLGIRAGYENQHDRTIVMNASDFSLNTAYTRALYINPIRNNAISTSNILAYDPDSKEVFFTDNVVSADVSNNFLSKIDASSNYLTKDDAYLTYISTTNANTVFLTKDDANVFYLKQETAESNYLRKTDAVLTYLSKIDASNNYLKTTDISNTYLAKTTATSTYLSKIDASNNYWSKAEQLNISSGQPKTWFIYSATEGNRVTLPDYNIGSNNDTPIGFVTVAPSPIGFVTVATAGGATYTAWDTYEAKFTAPSNGLYHIQLNIFCNSTNLVGRTIVMGGLGYNRGLATIENKKQNCIFNNSSTGQESSYQYITMNYMNSGDTFFFWNDSQVSLTLYYGIGHTNLKIIKIY